MEYLQQAGAIVGLIAYLFLVIALVRNHTQQSFTAFLLWALLDSIATITTILESGNYWLALSNAIGSTLITVLLIIKKQVSWSWVESMTALLVVICLVIWYTTGEQAGIVASSLAVVMASIPQMVDTYKKPEATPTLIYIIFLAANVLSLIGGMSWTIEQRFYQCCSIFLCLVIIGFSLRKRLHI